VAVVNASGGADGRQLKLTIQDDRGQGAQALALLQAQINSGAKPDVLIDGTADPESEALQPLVTRYGILAISNSTGYLAVNPSVSRNRTKFTTAANVTALAQGMAAYLKGKGYRRVAVIASNDSYGQKWASVNTQAAKSAGLQVTATASFDDSALDVTPQLQALQASRPDVVIGEAYGPPAGYLVADRQKLGWTGTPFVGAITISGQDLTKQVSKAALENVTMQTPVVQAYATPAQMRPGIRAFFEALKKLGPITQPLSHYGFEYDPVILAADAMTKAGSTDPAKVADALEHLGSVSGTVIQSTYFTPQDHFPGPDPKAFAFLAPGPLVDGMITGAS
jgi:branched-chain amino acid transport system substrate-binding protein